MSTPIPLPYSESSHIVTQGYDTDFSHKGQLKWGIDFGMSYDTDVKAMISGDIVAFRQDVEETFITGPASEENPASAGSGLGNYVTIRSTVDGEAVYITYAHLAPSFLEDNLGIVEAEQRFFEGETWGYVGFGDVFAQTGATGVRFTTRPESDGEARGAHLHVHIGTEIDTLNSAHGTEWAADGSSDSSPTVYIVFDEDSSAVPQIPIEFGPSYAGSDYSGFADANENTGNGPDLIITNVSIDDSSVAFGEPLLVTYDVTNIGNETAANHFTRFVFSDDETPSVDDVSSLDAIGTSLEAGETIRITSEVPTSIVPSIGSYNLIVVADHTNSISETNEINNESDHVDVEIYGGSGGGGDFVDLSISGLTVDGYSFDVGEQFDFYADISNIGVVDSSEFDIVVYLSKDADFENDEILFTLDDELGIDAGDVVDYDFYGFTSGSWAAGEYYLAVEIVSGDEEPGYTGNNIEFTTIYLQSDDPADLVIDSLALDQTTITEGSHLGMDIIVGNEGGTDTSSSIVGFYFSDDNVFDAADVLVDEKQVSGVAPGETDSTGNSVDLTSYAPGTYWLFAEADIYDAVDEGSGEGNNVSIGYQITIERLLNPVLGTGGSDFLIGTDGDDIITSLGGRSDIILGLGGSDVFVFGEETSNASKERDLIWGFDGTSDSIQLVGGAEIAWTFGFASFSLIGFEGDGDILMVFGNDVDSIVFDFV